MNEDIFHAWSQSLRRAAAASLGLARSRLELFSLECQEEKLRALNAIFWLVVSLSLMASGLILGVCALALCLWRFAGYGGLIGLAFTALFAGVGILILIRRRIRHGPPPFSQTVEEFKKDDSCFSIDPSRS